MYEDGEETYRYLRNADVLYILQTGGKGVPHRQNLWCLSASATQLTPMAEDANTVTFWSQPITNLQSIIIDGMNLGCDGKRWRTYADNDTRDVTVHVPGVDYFTFGVTTQKYTPTIMANGNDLSVTNPEFCVGQMITFNVGWDPGPPSVQTNSYDWVISSKYVNHQWQLYGPIDDQGTLVYYGSINYDVDPDVLKLPAPWAWVRVPR